MTSVIAVTSDSADIVKVSDCNESAHCKLALTVLPATTCTAAA